MIYTDNWQNTECSTEGRKCKSYPYRYSNFYGVNSSRVFAKYNVENLNLLIE